MYEKKHINKKLMIKLIVLLEIWNKFLAPMPNKDSMNKAILGHSMRWAEENEKKSPPWMEIKQVTFWTER